MGTGKKNYQAPNYITVDLLQKVLKEYFKEDTVEVHDLLIKSATGKGYGFASEMHRATFNIIRKDFAGKFSVIIKVHPKGEKGDVAEQHQLFEREMLVYKEILPRIEELLVSIDDNSKLTPACYYASNTPEQFLILEDMTLNGYDNYERGRLLANNFALPTIEKLAKLHACSAFIAAENPESMKFFEKPLILNEETDKPKQLGFFPAAVQAAATEVARWKGYEEIAVKLFYIADNVLESAAYMYETHEYGFRVLNLGDLWIDNLLFQNANTSLDPDDVVMLDFQLAYFGSPGIDLNYFLYGSVNENVRKVFSKYLVYTYHKVLSETLQKLKYEGEIPTLKSISIEIIRNSLQGVIAATCLTPLIFSENEDPESLSKVYLTAEDPNQILRENIENPKYAPFLKRTLKEFELNGFLDL